MARALTRPHRALVIEPNDGGHYLEYAAYVIQELQRHGVQVLVATSRDGAERLRQAQLTLANTNVLPLPSTNEVRPRQAAGLASKAKCDLVIVPSGDKFVYRMATLVTWPRRVAVLALLLRSPFVSPRIRIRDLAKRLALRWAQFRFPVSVLHLSGPGSIPICDIQMVQDVSRWNPPAAAPFSLGELTLEGRRWYAILGALDVRKNPDLVLRSLMAAGAEGRGLLLAGLMEPDTLESFTDSLTQFTEQGGDVVIINRRLTEEELDFLVDAVDCVVCAHSNEGPSGIMLKAAAAGQRVVAAGAQTLRRDCEVLDGCQWTPLTQEAMSSALANAFDKPRPRPRPVGSSESFGTEFLSPLAKVLKQPGLEQ